MQLLIIDIQIEFEACAPELCSKVLELSKNYNQIVYLYDKDYPSGVAFDMCSPMKEAYESGSFKPLIQDKTFFELRSDFLGEDAFWGSWIIKTMWANDLFTKERIKEHEDLFLAKGINVDKFDYSFINLLDVKEILSFLATNIEPGVHLVGGSRRSCLGEIKFFLDCLDISNSTLYEYTYY